MRRNSLELYIHIPFCVRKCAYCDFLSAPAPEEVRDRYMDALLAELAGRSAEAAGYEVSSVFIGGGTPSVVPACRIAGLLDAIRARYALRPDAEITIEVNPGTADGEKLAAYRAAGINRLSIGLQSASDEELKALGRIHSFRQFLATYEWARRAGFRNVNVDVMSALPGQSLSSCESTLRQVLALSPAPEHISAYSLIIEENTPFYEMEKKGLLSLPDEEQEREMYYRTGEILQAAGYRRYEISNYALSGFECRHNTGYWTRAEYLGFGIGAASLYREKRFRNGDNLSAYMADPLGCRTPEETLSVRELMEECMFLGLRMTDGVTEGAFRARFGKGLLEVYGPVIRRGEEEGVMRFRDGRLRLTERGVDVSNYVLSWFLF